MTEQERSEVVERARLALANANGAPNPNWDENKHPRGAGGRFGHGSGGAKFGGEEKEASDSKGAGYPSTVDTWMEGAERGTHDAIEFGFGYPQDNNVKITSYGWKRHEIAVGEGSKRCSFEILWDKGPKGEYELSVNVPGIGSVSHKDKEKIQLVNLMGKFTKNFDKTLDRLNMFPWKDFDELLKGK